MSRTVLVPATALAALLALTPAAFAMPMGGTFTAHVDNQSVQPLDNAGRVRIRKSSSGTNTGPGTPLDGASVRIDDSAMLKNGQGQVKGTIAFATPTGSTSSPFTGTVATDDRGRVTAEGRFSSVKGSGEFTGLKGRGTFSVAFGSPTDLTGNWQGDFQVPTQKTSRR